MPDTTGSSRRRWPSLESQVRQLYDAGARNFVVLNLPNLGKTPIVMQNQSYWPHGRTQADPPRRLQLSDQAQRADRVPQQAAGARAQRTGQRVARREHASPWTPHSCVDQILEGRRAGRRARALRLRLRAPRPRERAARRAQAGALPESLLLRRLSRQSGRLRACARSRRARCSGTSCIPRRTPTAGWRTSCSKDLARARARGGAGLRGRAPGVLHRRTTSPPGDEESGACARQLPNAYGPPRSSARR